MIGAPPTRDATPRVIQEFADAAHNATAALIQAITGDESAGSVADFLNQFDTRHHVRSASRPLFSWQMNCSSSALLPPSNPAAPMRHAPAARALAASIFRCFSDNCAALPLFAPVVRTALVHATLCHSSSVSASVVRIDAAHATAVPLFCYFYITEDSTPGGRGRLVSCPTPAPRSPLPPTVGLQHRHSATCVSRNLPLREP